MIFVKGVLRLTQKLAKKPPRKPPKHRLSERQQNIYDFLKNNPVAVVSTASKSGNPHGAVVYFYVDNNLDVYFVTKDQTHKFQNIKENNHVMLTVFDAQSQTVCQIEGATEIVSDQALADDVIGKILKITLKISREGEPPLSKLDGEYITLKIHPDNIKYSVYARPKPLNKDELFESIGWFELNAAHLP